MDDGKRQKEKKKNTVSASTHKKQIYIYVLILYTNSHSITYALVPKVFSFSLSLPPQDLWYVRSFIKILFKFRTSRRGALGGRSRRAPRSRPRLWTKKKSKECPIPDRDLSQSQFLPLYPFCFVRFFLPSNKFAIEIFLWNQKNTGFLIVNWHVSISCYWLSFGSKSARQ